MKIAFGAWRKLALIGCFLLTAMWIISDRRVIHQQLADLRVLYDTCVRHTDSLSTQLDVINSHRKKVEQMLENARASSRDDGKDFRLRIDVLERERNTLKSSLERCMSTSNRSTYIDENIAENKRLIEQNGKYQLEIEQLHEQIARLKMPSNGILSVDSKNDTLTNDHLQEKSVGVVNNSQHNYVGENSVHFHRENSHKDDREFVRNADSNPRIAPKLLAERALIKKLEERKKQFERHSVDGKDAVRSGEVVADYQRDAQPEENVADYKEMAH
jgi:hypothetical protein